MAELDRISNLPRDIKENILIRLPVKEAVRTCCLSTNWRLVWSSIPELVYDNHSISISDGGECPENLDKCTTKMVEFVDKFLSLHDSSIRKFAIAFVKPCFGALNGWLGVLSRKGIEEIQITSLPNAFVEIPETFWNLQCLREVELKCCIIELPRAFKGFKLLKSLVIKGLEISEADMSNLIASCPLLENLHLAKRMKGDLRIDAPMLKHLQLTCLNFSNFCLRTPSLVTARFRIKTEPFCHCEISLIHVLDCLPKLEKLCLGYSITRYLVCGYNSELSIMFYHLKSLIIVTNLGYQREAAFFRQLLHRAPNLQEITVNLSHSYYDYWGKCEWTQYTVFEHLKFVKTESFKNPESVFLFVAFLLASAPCLEELHFEDGEVKDPEFLQKLFQLKRASKKAKIFLPNN